MEQILCEKITWKLDGRALPRTASVTAVFNICFATSAAIEMGSFHWLCEYCGTSFHLPMLM